MAHDASSGNRIPQEVIDLAKDGIVDTISKYVDLKKAGKDYAACCPFHSERTPSFTVSEAKGIYQCFGCGAHGDAIGFVMEHEGLPFHEAVQSIVGNFQASGTAPQKRQVDRQQQDEWKPITPVPVNAGNPMSTFHRRKGDDWIPLEASRSWAYRDEAGNLIGYVCRFELPGGGKDLIPQSYCVNTQTGETRWKWLSFAKPRPLYGLEKLAAHPKAQVVIIEGEKACDAAQALYEAAGIPRDKLITVSWPGGGKAVKHVDWSPLAGRNVGLWPDADQKPYVDTHKLAGQLMPFIEQPGTVCMVEIANRLDGVANAIKFIMPPAGVPDGWDLADDLPEGFNLLQHTKSAAMLIADFLAEHTPKQADPDPVDLPWEGPATFEQLAEQLAPEHVEPDADAPKISQEELDELNHLVKNKYFTILGHEHENYYIFVHSKQQVIERTIGSFNEVGLVQLANDINWWEMNFPKKGGFDTKLAASWIDAIASSRGVYDPSMVRGRGAWTDSGRAIYHLGNRLLEDGKEIDLNEISSSYVYTRGKKMPRPASVMLTKEEGLRILDIAKQVRWSMQGSSVLVTGWVFLSSICGALKWRPHIWITGAAGSGKAQPHSARVLTESGWRNLGDIEVGDVMATPDGGYGRVLGVYPQGVQKTYKITFADGRVTRATGDHLWKVRINHDWRIRTTDQMVNILDADTRQAVSLAVPLTEPVRITRDRPEQEMPLHPYVLGVMLGDGHLGNVEAGSCSTIGLTCFDPEIADRVRELCPEWMGLFEKRTSPGQFRFGDLAKYGRKTRLLIKELRILGKKSHDKFIPEDYLCSTIENRWELLRGLMDTDGTICERGSMSYCSISKQLAEDVAYLVRSLGGVAKISEKKTTYTYLGEKREGQLAYNVNIRIKDRAKAFFLPRKVERASSDYQYEDCLYLNVKSIELDKEEECSCIMIDHPDRLYVTDDFVVTHNTTVMHDFCFSLTRGISLPSQGDSTEAGIRQKLSSDALPVLIDEFETNDEREKARVDGIIAMIRKASSETEAETYKGTTGGDGVSFKVRSMFCLASINTKLDKQADNDRITKLTIRVPPKDGSQVEHWRKLEADLYSLRDDDTIPTRLMARSITMIPTVLATVRVFVKVAAAIFKSQRTGDQYGTLIAGCWCMTNDHVPSEQEAEALISTYNWDEHTEDKDQDDSIEALNAIMGSKVRLPAGLGDVTVFELIRDAHSALATGEIDEKEATKQLHRIGVIIKEKEGFILFGNSVKALKDLVKNTAFSSDLRGQLLRLPGATRWNNRTERFLSAVCKCVAVPVSLVFGEFAGTATPSASAPSSVPDDFPI